MNEQPQKIQQVVIEEEPLIELGEITYTPQYESGIPRQITDVLLHRETLPLIPPLRSSIIEDFILNKVEAEIVDPQEIASAFLYEGIPQRIDSLIDEVKAQSALLNWSETFTYVHAKKSQQKVLNEMKEIGMTPEQIATIAAMNVDISESAGVSSLSEDAVYTSRLQAMRKAMDYRTVFGDYIPLEEILQALMSSVIGHELGHKIDSVAGIASNRIPADNTWIKNGKNQENKGERFAEYWGNVAIADNATYEAIKQREWLIHLAKVTQVWDTIATYNLNHESKADLGAIFRTIEEKLGEDNKNTATLLFARRPFYGIIGAENYASPYSKDVINKSVKPV